MPSESLVTVELGLAVLKQFMARSEILAPDEDA